MDFQVWDLPGQIDYLDPDFDAESIFGGVGAMIWVLDAIDNYMEPVSRLTETILHLQHSYPDIKYSVFIHKVDSLTEDFRDDTMRDVRQRITDDLYDAGLENPPITYYGTSIYDHSIFEAFSKVMQGLIPQLPTFEALINTVSASCRFEKAYLFDVYSKVYIASDTTPIDMKAYELCADLIDIIVDMSEVYGWDRGTDQQEAADSAKGIAAPSAESFVSNIKGYHLYLKEINRSGSLSLHRKEFHPTDDSQKPLLHRHLQKPRLRNRQGPRRPEHAGLPRHAAQSLPARLKHPKKKIQKKNNSSKRHSLLVSCALPSLTFIKFSFEKAQSTHTVSSIQISFDLQNTSSMIDSKFYRSFLFFISCHVNINRSVSCLLRTYLIWADESPTCTYV